MWFILRHGETLHNSQKILQGHYPSLLDLKGIDQIKSIAYRILDTKEDFSKYKLVTSPMVRTRHSMQIIREILGLADVEPIEEILIADTDCGKCVNMSRKKIKEIYPDLIETKDDNYWNFCYPGGETFNDVYDRISKFYEKYKNEENMIVVMHAKGVKFLVSMFEGEEKSSLVGKKANQNYFFAWDGKKIEKM